MLDQSILDKLKSKLQTAYTAEHVKELEQMETLFRFDHFSSKDALLLGNQIITEAKKYNEDLVVRIIRTEDQLTIFQYVGEDRTERNLEFAGKKGNTVAATGHCSLWALVQAFGGGSIPPVFEEATDFLPVGGAIPIIENGRMTAIVEVSGLHYGMDHPAVLEAVCAIRGCEVPAFHGQYI